VQREGSAVEVSKPRGKIRNWEICRRADASVRESQGPRITSTPYCPRRFRALLAAKSRRASRLRSNVSYVMVQSRAASSAFWLLFPAVVSIGGEMGRGKE
jgi:hypothetical protein